ncbi:hypothetical protein BU25DRAFT_388559 [Macroventuria anomochaeta]|uniref:Uncharacterized protein n=2 Tax=Macroventuria anomochaeta TaxID=301207 RepID=A0ACB6RUT0_9PLEO|nr:uncharacterized protein BU25DRAFT_396325 [Macroventuria anomochaeta]XP_033563694.1 uncharacterized protein BU25DRAFT_388559 [Macroventuria anomochaeta]KAF2625636.1 hypothetical protein BU25DRAFT_396325 [Macroventuria anomochaeta]KAF2629503.1 hypothetical protein BU25DRAFT_388559 [Macroventuria anomochaeta]
MDNNVAESSVLPWDTSVGNRFAHYSPENHSATVWIAAALALTYVVGVLLIRVFIKWRVFGWDDSLIVISTALAFVQSIVVFSALKNGLGKFKPSSLPTAGADRLQLAFSSRALFVASHYLAKLSVLFLLRRLFVRDQKNTALLCDITIALTTLSGIVSVLVSTIRCPSSLFLTKHCHGQIARWSLVTALDVTSEGLTLILPSYMVWQVQMKVETKLRVIAAFCFRLVVIALSAVHLDLWISYSNGQPSSLAVVPTFILQQTLMATSLISATIPNLKAFLQSLSASWGEAEFSSGYTTKAYGNGTFEMNNLNSHAPPASRTGMGDLYSAKSHPDFETQVTTSQRIAGERSSLGSGESQDLIIRKETAWTVERI